MSDDTDDVTAYNKKHVAPNFKRRQLIFDSFSKLQFGTQSKIVKDGGPRGGALLYTWGAGYHGQLGIEAKRKKCEMIPVQINFNEPVIIISCGGFHTAVVTESGSVYTWGDGRMGQLGNLEAKYNMHPNPQKVTELESKQRARIVDLSCGQYHTACVSTQGELFTWGSGKYGQIGHGDKSTKRKPHKVATSKSIGRYSKVACGDKHTVCLTRAGKVVTFGSGQHGQLGHGGETHNQKRNAAAGLDELKPRLVKDMEKMDVKWIAAGATVTSCVTVEGEMWLWGFGESIHPVGVPNIVYKPRRVDFFVHKKETIVQVGIGQSHIVVLSERGDVWAFGNLYIKRSVSASEAAVAKVREPRLILKNENIREIACGRYHTKALTNCGVLFSWGIGESGQLGHNRLQSNEFPQLVEWILPNVVGKIACGDHHSFCLSSIRFHEVHPEVKRWKKLQDRLLMSKLGRREEHTDGLKTEDIKAVDDERKGLIIEQMQADQKAEEQQRKLLTVQLESIQMRSQIEEMVKSLKDAKKKANKRIRAQAKKEEEEKRLKHATQKKRGGSKKKQSLPVMTGRSTVPGDRIEAGETELPYQPLMPRIGFMEMTQKSLMEVKKRTEQLKSSGLSVVKPNVKKFMRELFEQKKEYNKLREINKNLVEKHSRISKEISFMRPTEDDLNQKRRNQRILDDLKMKLVTKDTQLMETEENKSNYNLYIIRMKEENLVISKSIDQLRQTVREYDRLVAKLEKVCNRVNGQRTHIQDEITNFSKDIQSFSDFTSQQLSRYKQMINSTSKAKKMQKQSQVDREAKMTKKRKLRMRELVREHESKQKEAERIQKEKTKFAKKVEYYTQRFRMISEATGLKEPEDIINKFFSNDKIAEDLLADIKAKKELSKQLVAEKSTVLKDIEDKKTSFRPSKWRDISKQENNMQTDQKRFKKLKSEVERIANRMLVIKEGINSLLASVQIATGEDEDYEEDVGQALIRLRERIGHVWQVAKPQLEAIDAAQAETAEDDETATEVEEKAETPGDEPVAQAGEIVAKPGTQAEA